jgi:hypothetical protein
MQLKDLAAAEASNLKSSISASFDKLIQAATAEADRQMTAARAEARKALDAATAERTALAAALEEERVQRANAEKQLKEQSAAQAFTEAARREAEAAREKEAAAREKEAAAREQEAAARQTAERELAAERDRARQRDADHERALKQAQTAHDRAVEQAEAAHERALQQAEAGHAEQLRTEKARLAKTALQPLDHLRTAFDHYRAASTIDDALGVLLESLATEFTRVAVFDVNAHRLEVSRHTGFDGHDMSKVVVPLTMQSPLTRAVKDGKVQGLTARELTETTRALVGGSPNFVLVLPVPIRGQVRAVVYADDSSHAEGVSPERLVKFAEILLWHTVPLLTRLALEEEALAEFREYAASIVSDLESVYVADAAKHKPTELRKRLQLNLQYARRRFAERMQSEGQAAARLLDEQLTAAIERKGETPFGRDLAAVAS